MNKTISFVATLVLLLGSSALKAQSLSDLFSSTSATDVVASVTGGSSITASNVEGEWDYVSPAVELSSDNVLTSAAGAVVTSQLESKLSDVCTKAGIEAGTFAFVFNSDMTFTSNVKGKNLGGSYTVDADNGTITLNYGVYNTITIGSLTANVTLVSSSMSLLFAADKLLDLISAISTVSSNDTIATVAALAEQYNGVKMGFELNGGSTSTSTTSTAVEAATSAATSALSKLF